MWKYFTAKKTYQYIDAVPQLVHGYNSRIHAAHKLPPAHVNQDAFQQVWNRLVKSSLPSASVKIKHIKKVIQCESLSQNDILQNATEKIGLWKYLK